MNTTTKLAIMTTMLITAVAAATPTASADINIDGNCAGDYNDDANDNYDYCYGVWRSGTYMCIGTYYPHTADPFCTGTQIDYGSLT